MSVITTKAGGLMLKKKMYPDSDFQDAFIWIDKETRALYWSSSKDDIKNQKFISLRQTSLDEGDPEPQGQAKGIIRFIRRNCENVTIGTLTGADNLDLKFISENPMEDTEVAAAWVSAIKTIAGI